VKRRGVAANSNILKLVELDGMINCSSVPPAELALGLAWQLPYQACTDERDITCCKATMQPQHYRMWKSDT